ncbi:MAG: acetate--CoA ligase family protein [Deltaproteobacteria bacterium]|nr:acetate--CoA ligase family protein [Deltaproteobacteria bacterium]
MDLLEYQGKQFFASYGIPVSDGEATGDVDAAVAIADRVGYPVVVKAQVQVGGRGKAGGIQLADDEAAVRELVDRLRQCRGTNAHVLGQGTGSPRLVSAQVSQHHRLPIGQFVGATGVLGVAVVPDLRVRALDTPDEVVARHDVHVGQSKPFVKPKDSRRQACGARLDTGRPQIGGGEGPAP